VRILFVHPNFPAQFGHIATRLAAQGDECAFVSRAATGLRAGVRCIQYTPKGGATRANHYTSRTFENAVWNAHGVYEACKTSGLEPDLIVGHCGFGTTLFLPEIYGCPIVSYFEYYYRPHDSDMDFRPEFAPTELDFLRARARNAMILLDLDACAAGYTPTHWQKSLVPPAYASKVETIHDGIDVDAWRRRPVERRLRGEALPPGTRVVTYAARGLEAMRGFDIFVRLANRIAAERADVVFVVVGSDRVAYGNDLRHIKTPTFREHVLATERPDLGRFRFLGTVPPEELAAVLSLSDLHVYLTVPFVPSWSLLNALACECVVLASDTPPVREIIDDGRNGLLAPFYDLDALTTQALRVLDRPEEHRPLATAGRALVDGRYSLDVTLPRLRALFGRLERAPNA
jgi:glycosyltransferase involved in cell wall biosynthesis